MIASCEGIVQRMVSAGVAVALAPQMTPSRADHAQVHVPLPSCCPPCSPLGASHNDEPPSKTSLSLIAGGGARPPSAQSFLIRVSWAHPAGWRRRIVRWRPECSPFACRAAVPGGFTKDDFTIDTGTVTCPAGQPSPSRRPTTSSSGSAASPPAGVALHDGEGRVASEPPSPGGRVDRPGEPGRRRHSHAKVPGSQTRVRPDWMAQAGCQDFPTELFFPSDSNDAAPDGRRPPSWPRWSLPVSAWVPWDHR